MSENNLSDIIYALASNKEIAQMAQKIKESGDFESILSEVSSLLGGKSSSDSADDALSKESPLEKNEERFESEADEVDLKDLFDSLQDDSRQSGEAKENERIRKGDGIKDNERVGEASTLLSGLLPLFSKSICENSALLIALKPYLSKKRCDLIDSIIKISKLASIVSLAK